MADATGFLAALTQAEADALLAEGRRHRYAKGAYLMHEGEAAEHVVVVRRGRVKVVKFNDDGRELLLAVKGPGDLLGEVSTLDGGLRSASVLALEPVDGVVIPATSFERFLVEHTRVALLILRTVLGRLRDQERRRAEFSQGIASRVARQLVELSAHHGEPEGNGVRITLALSHDELAAMVGASRETVSRALSTLRSHGVIATQRRSIHVVDPDRLLVLAGSG